VTREFYSSGRRLAICQNNSNGGVEDQPENVILANGCFKWLMIVGLGTNLTSVLSICYNDKLQVLMAACRGFVHGFWKRKRGSSAIRVFRPQTTSIRNWISPICKNTLRQFPNIFYHPRSGVVFYFRRICQSDDNFRKSWYKNFIFAHPVYFQEIWVTFAYEGHRLKFKATPAKMVESSSFHNVKLPLAIIPVL